MSSNDTLIKRYVEQARRHLTWFYDSLSSDAGFCAMPGDVLSRDQAFAISDAIRSMIHTDFIATGKYFDMGSFSSWPHVRIDVGDRRLSNVDINFVFHFEEVMRMQIESDAARDIIEAVYEVSDYLQRFYDSSSSRVGALTVPASSDSSPAKVWKHVHTAIRCFISRTYGFYSNDGCMDDGMLYRFTDKRRVNNAKCSFYIRLGECLEMELTSGDARRTTVGERKRAREPSPERSPRPIPPRPIPPRQITPPPPPEPPRPVPLSPEQRVDFIRELTDLNDTMRALRKQGNALVAKAVNTRFYVLQQARNDLDRGLSHLFHSTFLQSLLDGKDTLERFRDGAIFMDEANVRRETVGMSRKIENVRRQIRSVEDSPHL